MPTNSMGGPCSLGQWIVFMPQKHHWVQTKRDLLRPWQLDCNDDIHLWISAEYITLTIFIIQVIVDSLNVAMAQLACSMIKATNATSVLYVG